MKEFMKGYGKYLIFSLFLILVLLWISGFFTPKMESGEVRAIPKKVSGLKIEEVKKVNVVEEPYVGQIEASERAEIATSLFGKIISVYVKEGDCVKRGQLLVRIEGEELQSRILASDYQIKEAEAEYRRAQAEYEVARKTFERYEKLLQAGAVTPQEFDEVKGRFESSKEALERAKAAINTAHFQKKAIAANLKYVNLSAPFEGCVVEKKVDPGDLAVPGTPLFVLEKRPYVFRAELPEKFFSTIKVGSPVKIILSEDEKEVEGVVVEKSPSIDPYRRTFKIKVRLEEDQKTRSGSLAYILIPQEREALFVPKKAILRRYDFTGVFVVNEKGLLELRWVKLGRERGDWVEVVSGLKPGERIVVEGIERACDGCQLE